MFDGKAICQGWAREAANLLRIGKEEPGKAVGLALWAAIPLLGLPSLAWAERAKEDAYVQCMRERGYRVEGAATPAPATPGGAPHDLPLPRPAAPRGAVPVPHLRVGGPADAGDAVAGGPQDVAERDLRCRLLRAARQGDARAVRVLAVGWGVWVAPAP